MATPTPFDAVTGQAQALGVRVSVDHDPKPWATGDKDVSRTHLECSFEQAPLVRELLGTLTPLRVHSESRYYFEGSMEGHRLVGTAPVLGLHVGLVAARWALNDPAGVKAQALLDFGTVRPSAEGWLLRLLHEGSFGDGFGAVSPLEDTLTRLLLDAAKLSADASTGVWVEEAIHSVLVQIGEGDHVRVAKALHAGDVQPPVVVVPRPLPTRGGPSHGA